MALGAAAHAILGTLPQTIQRLTTISGVRECLGLGDGLGKALMEAIGVWFRLAAGFVFLFGAGSKLRQPAEFRRALVGYHILKDRIALRRCLFIAIPPLELAIGLGLGLPRPPAFPLVAGGALLLLIAFSVGLLENARRGIHSVCGCGPIQGRTRYSTFVRNLILVVIIGIAATIETRLGTPNLSTVEWVGVMGLSFLAALLLVAAPILFDEFKHQLTHVS